MSLCASASLSATVLGVRSSGRSFNFWVTFVVRWGPILVAVPGAGGGKWIVVGGYSVGNGGGMRGFFLLAMVRTGQSHKLQTAEG
jgi:hypothetical protein